MIYSRWVRLRLFLPGVFSGLVVGAVGLVVPEEKTMLKFKRLTKQVLCFRLNRDAQDIPIIQMRSIMFSTESMLDLAII